MIPLLLILLIVGASEARAQTAPNNKSFSVPAENMPQLGNYNFTSNAIASPSIPSPQMPTFTEVPTCISCGSAINSGIPGSCDPGYEPVITSTREIMCAKDLKPVRWK